MQLSKAAFNSLISGGKLLQYYLVALRLKWLNILNLLENLFLIN